MRKIALMMLGLLWLSVQVFAQGRVITGLVTDDKGDPVGYASIKVKNSKI